jgi:hypothetical protein
MQRDDSPSAFGGELHNAFSWLEAFSSHGVCGVETCDLTFLSKGISLGSRTVYGSFTKCKETREARM